MDPITRRLMLCLAALVAVVVLPFLIYGLVVCESMTEAQMRALPKTDFCATR